eukprot:GHVS01002839.1.p1 GENE.GHVS01002839.1~~GHVS01002839.1.p1  ORF type:complete len:166 (-),score=5.83 GHVS01002839.1:276-773(-)
MNLFLVFLLLLHLALPACAIPDTCVLLFYPIDDTGVYSFSPTTTPTGFDMRNSKQFIFDTVGRFGDSVRGRSKAQSLASSVKASDYVKMFKTHPDTPYVIKFSPASGEGTRTVLTVNRTDKAVFQLIRCNRCMCKCVAVEKRLFQNAIDGSEDGRRLLQWTTRDG